MAGWQGCIVITHPYRGLISIEGFSMFTSPTFFGTSKSFTLTKKLDKKGTESVKGSKYAPTEHCGVVTCALTSGRRNVIISRGLAFSGGSTKGPRQWRAKKSTGC